MATIYDKLGVRTLINAAGTATRWGGSLMPQEVLEAMEEAARSYVRVEDLQEAAGKVIAEVTGAEAGYVSNGAAGGLMLATAACVAGLDPAKMDLLPDTTGMKNEVVVQRGHRNAYDHAIRAVGIKMVEVGYLGYPGAGMTHPWQIEAAINERTAAVLCPVMDTKGTVPLREVARIAHRHAVPVIVDAAAALPPAGNLRRFTAEGADMVVFSGGKAIRGPQASGIIAGRRDLIRSIALQNQDMDVLPETWTYRQQCLASGIMGGPPHHGIGRACKVGKEEIAGLIAALRRYVVLDHDLEREMWHKKAGYLAAGLQSLDYVRVDLITPEAKAVPQVYLSLDEHALGFTSLDVVNRLLEGEPMIAVGQGLAYEGTIILNPCTIEDGQEEIIARRLTEVLAGKVGG
ncbi:MAG: aminotransferase class V-fold PLP-dependent enzyme [Chloroflexi bacterium]|nr:aminotransferase class V-fold PLP-dependent enzyme [Chloroflexota bacterium]